VVQGGRRIHEYSKPWEAAGGKTRQCPHGPLGKELMKVEVIHSLARIWRALQGLGRLCKALQGLGVPLKSDLNRLPRPWKALEGLGRPWEPLTGLNLFP
jgi:hypothetical protein